MRTDFCISPRVVEATAESRLLVRSLRLTCEMARNALPRLAQAAESLARIEKFRERPEYEALAKSALAGAMLDLDVWYSGLPPAATKLEEHAGTIRDLLAEAGPAAERDAAACLAVVQNPECFPGFEPQAWETLLALRLAEMVASVLRESFQNDIPRDANKEPRQILKAVRCAIAAGERVGRLVGSDADLERMASEISRDFSLLDRQAEQPANPDKAGAATRFRDLANEFRSVASTPTPNGGRQLVALARRAGVLLRQAVACGAVRVPEGFPWPSDSLDWCNKDLAAFASESDWTLFVAALDEVTRLTNGKTGLPPNLLEMAPKPVPSGFVASYRETRPDDWPIRARSYAAVCDWIADGCDAGGEPAPGEKPAAKRPAERTQSGHSRKKFKPRGKVNQDLWIYYKRNKSRLAKGAEKIDIVREFCRLEGISIEKADTFIRSIHRWEKGVKSDV